MRILFLKILYPLLSLSTIANPYYAVINYAFISIIRPEQLTYGSSVIGKVFAVAIVCVVIASIRSGAKILFIKPKFFLFLWSFIAFLALSTFMSPFTDYGQLGRAGYRAGNGSIYYLKQLPQIAIYCSCLFMILLGKSSQKIVFFIGVILFFFMIMACWGIQQWFLGNKLVEGLFGLYIVDRTSISGVYVLYLPLTLYFILHRRGIIKLLGVVCFFTFFAIIVLSQSRGGFLGLCMSFTVMVFYLRKNVQFWKLFIMFILVVVCLSPSFYIDRIKQISAPIDDNEQITDYSGASRLLLWSIAVDVFRDHPFIGVGNMNFPKASQGYAIKYSGRIDPRLYEYVFGVQGKKFKVHNMFLNILAEGGLLAAIPFFLLLFHPLYIGNKTIKNTSKGTTDLFLMQALLIAGILGFLLTAVFTNDRYVDYLYWNLTLCTLINVKLDQTLMAA